ncbi:hypothetical protein F5878DRAFT_639859, partial [Lentinula raphanica]
LVIQDESFDLPSILSKPRAAQKVNLEASLWSDYFVSLEASALFGSTKERDSAFKTLRDIDKLKKKCKRRDADFVDSSDYVDCAQKYSRQFVHPDDLWTFNEAWKTYKFKRIQDLARVGPDGQWLRIDSIPTATDVTALIIGNDFFDLPSLQSNPRTAQKVHLATRLWPDYFVYLDASVHFVSVGKKTSTFQSLRDIVELEHISERPTGFASNLDYITCALWYMKVYGGVKYAEHHKMDKVWKTYMASMPSPQPAPPGSAQIEQIEQTASVPSPQPARPGSAQIEQIEQLASVSSPQPAPPGSAQTEQIERSASVSSPQPAPPGSAQTEQIEQLASASHSQDPLKMRLRLGRVRNRDGSWAVKKFPHLRTDLTYVVLFDDQGFDLPSISDPETTSKRKRIPRTPNNAIDWQYFWDLRDVRFPGEKEKQSVFETLGNLDKLKGTCKTEIRDSFGYASCVVDYIGKTGYIKAAILSKDWESKVVGKRNEDLKEKKDLTENKAKDTKEAQTVSLRLRVGRVSTKSGAWLTKGQQPSRSSSTYVVLFGETTFFDFPSISNPEHPLKKNPIATNKKGIYRQCFWTLADVSFPDEETKNEVFSYLADLEKLEAACKMPITNDFEYAECVMKYIEMTEYFKKVVANNTGWGNVVDYRRKEIEAQAADNAGANSKPTDSSAGPSGGGSSRT